MARLAGGTLRRNFAVGVSLSPASPTDGPARRGRGRCSDPGSARLPLTLSPTPGCAGMRQTQPTGSHGLESGREGKGSPLLAPCTVLGLLRLPRSREKKNGRRPKEGGEKPSSASKGSFTFPRLSRGSASECLKARTVSPPLQAVRQPLAALPETRRAHLLHAPD